MGRLVFIPETFVDTGSQANLSGGVPVPVYSTMNNGVSNSNPTYYTNLPFVPHNHFLHSNYVEAYAAYYALGFEGKHHAAALRTFPKTTLDQAFRSYRDIENWVGANSERDVLARYSSTQGSFEFWFFDEAIASQFQVMVYAELTMRQVKVERSSDLSTADLEAWAKESLSGRFTISTGWSQFFIWCAEPEDAVVCRLRWSGAAEQAI